jgi:peptidoglycan/xylan/chitin deacetylase (PgdA/CDA1 family)
MYHYVRDLENTPYPRISAMLIGDFERQAKALSDRYEMATLVSALDFLSGVYVPERDLCLLTFDDGIKDHYLNVFPILADMHIQGIFFVITSCLDKHRVASVHKNHFLMALLGLERYKEIFTKILLEISPKANMNVNPDEARRYYRWDSLEVAEFKYLLNFRLSEDTRGIILNRLFKRYIGNEEEFADYLYMSWDEVKRMQHEKMIIGGHSNEHVALSSLELEQQRKDLSACKKSLRDHLNSQNLWPFSYPYGKMSSFNLQTVKFLRKMKFDCSFSTEVGRNDVGQDIYTIRRIDPKDIL